MSMRHFIILALAGAGVAEQLHQLYGGNITATWIPQLQLLNFIDEVSLHFLLKAQAISQKSPDYPEIDIHIQVKMLEQLIDSADVRKRTSRNY